MRSILDSPERRALVLILVAPLFLLWPSIFGGRTYVPYDLAIFPPVSTTLNEDDLAEVRANSNFDVNEIPIWFAPELEMARQALADGRFPHWNSYARGGTALMAHGLDGLLYPPNWLALAHEKPADGLWMLAYVSFVVAGLLMYGFLRELGIGIVAALFGALVFAYSGTATANAHFYMRLASLVWLPGLLWSALRIARTEGWARGPGTIGLALTMACTWLAGFPPYSAPVTLVAASWCLYLVVNRGREDGARAAGNLALPLLFGAVLGLGAAAVHLLPVIEFFPVSNRTPDQSLAHIAPSAFDPMGFLGYFLPDAFGHPSLTTLPYANSPLALYLYSGENWETGEGLLANYNFTEYAVFAGTATLFLVVIGVLTRGSRHRWFLIGMLAALFLLAIAPWPLRYLYALPGLKTVPPMRFVGPACLFVAALGAMGLDRLGELSGRVHKGLLASAVGLALLCALGAVLCSGSFLTEQLDVIGSIADKYRHLNPGLIDREFVQTIYLRGPDGLDYLETGRVQLRSNLWRCAGAMAVAGIWIGLLPMVKRRGLLARGAALVVIATALELLVFGAGLNQGKELPFSHDTDVHTFLREQRDASRDTGGFTVARAHSEPIEPYQLPPGTLGPQGIRDLNTYTFLDGLSHKPLLALYGPDFMIRGYLPRTFPDTEALELPLFDLFGVRYWLSTVPLEHGGARVGPEVQGPGGEFFIYERASPSPRAFMVPRLEVLADDDAVVQALISPDLDPRDAVLMTPDQAELLGPWRPAEPGGERRITFVADHGAELELEIEPGPPGYLVLADTALPGWTVELNDAPVPMARGNLFQRVVPITEEGLCSVRFVYTTPGLHTGLAITTVSLLILLGLGLNLAFSRRHGEIAENSGSHPT